MQRHLLFILLTLPMVPACDDNVGADYKGEPLISLRGQVLAPADARPGDLEVALAWHRFATNGDLTMAEATAVDGSFPAAFELDVYAPPSGDVLNHAEEGDAGVALAYIMAVPTGTKLDTLSVSALEGVVEGVVESHVLAYVPADIAAGSPIATFVGGPMTAGFHLLQATPASADELAEYEACLQQDDNLGCEYPFDHLTLAPDDTLLNLTLGDFDPPNFT